MGVRGGMLGGCGCLRKELRGCGCGCLRRDVERVWVFEEGC